MSAGTKRVSVAALLIGLAGLAAYVNWPSLRKWLPGEAKQMATPPAGIPTPPLDATAPEPPAAPAAEMALPFQPVTQREDLVDPFWHFEPVAAAPLAVEAKPSQAPPDFVAPELSLVLRSAGVARACLDQQIVGVGDTVRGARVLTIEASHVVLQWQEREITVPLRARRAAGERKGDAAGTANVPTAGPPEPSATEPPSQAPAAPPAPSGPTSTLPKPKGRSGP